MTPREFRALVALLRHRDAMMVEFAVWKLRQVGSGVGMVVVRWLLPSTDLDDWAVMVSDGHMAIGCSQTCIRLPVLGIARKIRYARSSMRTLLKTSSLLPTAGGVR